MKMQPSVRLDPVAAATVRQMTTLDDLGFCTACGGGGRQRRTRCQPLRMRELRGTCRIWSRGASHPAGLGDENVGHDATGGERSVCFWEADNGQQTFPRGRGGPVAEVPIQVEPDCARFRQAALDLSQLLHYANVISLRPGSTCESQVTCLDQADTKALERNN